MSKLECRYFSYLRLQNLITSSFNWSFVLRKNINVGCNTSSSSATRPRNSSRRWRVSESKHLKMEHYNLGKSPKDQYPTSNMLNRYLICQIFYGISRHHKLDKKGSMSKNNLPSTIFIVYLDSELIIEGKQGWGYPSLTHRGLSVFR